VIFDKTLGVLNVSNNLFVQSKVLFFDLFLTPPTNMTWRDQRETHFLSELGGTEVLPGYPYIPVKLGVYT